MPHDFKNIFDKYYQKLCLHAYSFVGDEETAKDIVNDVFVSFLEHYDRFMEDDDMPEDKGAILYMITRNHCLNYLRRQKVKEKYTEYINFTYSEDESNFYVDYEENLKQAEKLLDILSPQARRVVELCFIEGKSYKETAEIMGISPNTVRNHIVASLKKMREKSKKLNLLLVHFPFLFVV